MAYTHSSERPGGSSGQYGGAALDVSIGWAQFQTVGWFGLERGDRHISGAVGFTAFVEDGRAFGWSVWCILVCWEGVACLAYPSVGEGRFLLALGCTRMGGRLGILGYIVNVVGVVGWVRC